MAGRKSAKHYWRWALLAFFAVLGVVVVWRNWSTVHTGLLTAYHAKPLWLGLLLACSASTFILAAAAYNTLALRPLRYHQTLLVELASAFVNRLLPAGIGGLGLHGDYLYKRGHTVAQATAVVSANNLLGIVGHVLLLGVVLVLAPAARVHVQAHMPGWWILAGITLLVAMVAMAGPIRRRVSSFVRHVLASLRQLRAGRLVQALLCLVVLTTVNTLALWAAGSAVGLHISVFAALVVLSCGVFGATLTPTPGGLVGAEAGLVMGYALFGIAATPAAAAIVLFRLAIYWLPMLPGVAALAAIRRLRLV